MVTKVEFFLDRLTPGELLECFIGCLSRLPISILTATLLEKLDRVSKQDLSNRIRLERDDK